MIVTQENHPRLVGHSVRGNKRLKSVQDVADFICKHGQYGDVTVTYDGGKPFLDTFGIYLNRIADMEYREKLLKILIPMQTEIESAALTDPDEEDIQNLTM